MHDDNCFVTLTYDDEHLPMDYSVDVVVFQRFMKRLRKKYGAGIRFFHCGEYGDKSGRPHYHALLFNFDFPDRKLWKKSSGGDLYRSASLERLWPFGLSSVGQVSFQSAAYVAGYIQKKVSGDAASAHYRRIHPLTGLEVTVRPEYATMSKGIGLSWFEAWKDEVYPRDEVVVNGKVVKPPRYYDRKMKEQERSLASVKTKRRKAGEERKEDQTPERLKVREKVKEAYVSMKSGEL